MTYHADLRAASSCNRSDPFTGRLMAFTHDVGSVETPSIAVEKFALATKEFTVTRGTKVAWTHHDETARTMRATTVVLMSKAMDSADRVEFTFASEGDFSYFCTLHPFMTGVVHVRK